MLRFAQSESPYGLHAASAVSRPTASPGTRQVALSSAGEPVLADLHVASRQAA